MTNLIKNVAKWMVDEHYLPWRLSDPDFYPRMHPVEYHETVQAAYAVARKINRSAYVKRQMYVADLLLQRKN